MQHDKEMQIRNKPASTAQHKNELEIPSAIQASRIVTYKPLGYGEIRLVNFGATGDEPVFVHALLDDLPQYTAISYCWGDENCLNEFEINGQVMILTSSLLIIFLELRRRGFTGMLWADAVCINQLDASEKAVYIPLMGTVYRKAWEVFAWLGSGSPDTAISEDFMLRLSTLLDDEAREKHEKIRGKFREHTEKYGLPPPSHRTWDDFMEIIDSPWFGRLWTLQEAVFAQTLVLAIGRLSIPWRMLYDVQMNLAALDFDDIGRHVRFHNDMIAPLNRIYNTEYYRYAFSQGFLAMGTVLGTGRLRKASRAQDKVYALYNLMGSDFTALMPVDLSVSTQRTFIRAAKALMSVEPRSLILLANAHSNSNSCRLPDLPSWVPDFTTPTLHWNLTQFHEYDAGKATTVTPKPHVSLADGEDELRLEGFRLGTVTHMSRLTLTFDNTNTLPDTRADDLEFWIMDCIFLASEKLDLAGRDVFELVGRTIACNRPGLATGDNRMLCPDSVGEDLMDDLQTLADHGNLDVDFDESRMMSNLRSLFYRGRGCSFFITDKGHLGLGHDTLEIGDDIVILHGAEVPFTIRKRPTGSCVQYIGECYVDGVMEGQAVDAHRESGGEDEMFTFN